MKTSTTSLKFALLALILGRAHAGPVGPDNYDFARFGHPVAWSQAGNYGGWTRASADVNGDRRMDLVLYAQDADSWRTWVALSNGDGTFSPGVSWSVAGNWVDRMMLVADANGDARTDLISLSLRADGVGIAVALSKGNGVFDSPSSTDLPGNYAGWTTALGDVNGDARPDLIFQTVNESRWLTHVALNSGGGSFAAPIARSALGDFRDANVGVGDFDGNGRTDVALDSNGPAGWRSWVALSMGGGSFAAPVQWVVNGEFGGWTPARADFDADGRTDLQLWTYDAQGWRSQIAMSDGSGSFRTPVTWTSDEFGAASGFSLGDFNADGAADMVAQRVDAKGWHAQVAISLGDGTFIAPKLWADLDQDYAGWRPSIMDISGDGRADVIAHLSDAAGWRASSALARPCDTIISNQDDVVGRIGGLPNLAGGQVVCFKPGAYEGEILVAGKRDIAFVAPHGDVRIESDSYAFSPQAVEGRDPGAPIQVWESESIEFDGLTIKNRFTYRVTPDGDQAYMVSRAIEVLRSRDVTLSHSHLVSAGKQTVLAQDAHGLALRETLVECYYFCVDARQSSVRAQNSYFRANHAAIPADAHAMFWTAQSDQSYVNSTMEFVTGKGVFAGINDFNKNSLEVAGETIVSPSAEGWVAQHETYDGLNLRLSGTYTELAEWYFMGRGWQRYAQVCHAPDGGWSHCVSHSNVVATTEVATASCQKGEDSLWDTLERFGIRR